MDIRIPPDLKKILLDIDGRGYKAYKCLQEKTFFFSPFTVCFEHVQGDPFAQPSRISVKIDTADAGFEEGLYNTPVRRLAFEDHLLRIAGARIRASRINIGGTGKSGEVFVQRPGQKVIKRNALLVNEHELHLVLFAGLPGEGRTILGGECLRLFSEVLPPVWSGSLLASSVDLEALQRSVHTLEDYHVLREELQKNGWAAFVADASLLPRASGISDLPLDGGIRFRAPENLFAEVSLPHAGTVRGMPIPEGVTLIVGGGFHGKSTLLRAVQDAVYPHVPGDGRERIAAKSSAVKIRAEDGRSVKAIDVSGFMKRLPGVESTQSFATQSASGSTSQAVNILEALESGSELLLMDEDTCAANFMIRDARMQSLIRSEMEPIIPFLDRVREIYDDLGVSIILVMGGSGDYFECADEVIAMEMFEPRRVTEEAKRIVQNFPGKREEEASAPLPAIVERRADLGSMVFSRGKRDVVVQAHRLDTLVVGRTEVDVRYVEQFAECGQLEMCGWMLNRLKMAPETDSNMESLRKLFREFEGQGFDMFTPCNNGLLALPRIQEVIAALNRIR